MHGYLNLCNFSTLSSATDFYPVHCWPASVVLVLGVFLHMDGILIYER